MGNETTEKQSSSRRTMCAEPTVAHGRKHEQPWKDVREQSKGKGYDQIARAKPKSRYEEEIQKRKRDPNRIVHGHCDRHFITDWWHPSDVAVQNLPTSYRSKPPTSQT